MDQRFVNVPVGYPEAGVIGVAMDSYDELEPLDIVDGPVDPGKARKGDKGSAAGGGGMPPMMPVGGGLGAGGGGGAPAAAGVGGVGAQLAGGQA